MAERLSEFESAVKKLTLDQKNKLNKQYVATTLRGAADIAEKDDEWIYDEVNKEPEPEPEVEPEAKETSKSKKK